jgi:hypothetical protein
LQGEDVEVRSVSQVEVGYKQRQRVTSVLCRTTIQFVNKNVSAAARV